MSKKSILEVVLWGIWSRRWEADEYSLDDKVQRELTDWSFLTHLSLRLVTMETSGNAIWQEEVCSHWDCVHFLDSVLGSSRIRGSTSEQGYKYLNSIVICSAYLLDETTLFCCSAHGSIFSVYPSREDSSWPKEASFVWINSWHSVVPWSPSPSFLSWNWKKKKLSKTRDTDACTILFFSASYHWALLVSTSHLQVQRDRIFHGAFFPIL